MTLCSITGKQFLFYSSKQIIDTTVLCLVMHDISEPMSVSGDISHFFNILVSVW